MLSGHQINYEKQFVLPETRWMKERCPKLKRRIAGVNTAFVSVLRRWYGGDLVDYRFECNFCGTHFLLGAETYPGSGGYWSPENEKPSEIID